MLATEPADRTQASEPIEPTDKIEPAEPIDKMEPVEPIDRMQPVEPMLRIDPDEPTERTEPPPITMGSFCRNGYRTFRPQFRAIWSARSTRPSGPRTCPCGSRREPEVTPRCRDR